LGSVNENQGKTVIFVTFFMAVAEKNYYQILGITRTAGSDEIKRAYRHLAMKHHPDKNQGNKQSEELFKEIQQRPKPQKNPQSLLKAHP
jgi:curved DNA-binding protein CbpA